MPIQYTERQAAFVDLVGVDEAESLLEWLQGKKAATIDLSACTHVHPANLQVLLAAKALIGRWPADHDLTGLLKTILTCDDTGGE